MSVTDTHTQTYKTDHNSDICRNRPHLRHVTYKYMARLVLPDTLKLFDVGKLTEAAAVFTACCPAHAKPTQLSLLMFSESRAA